MRNLLSWILLLLISAGCAQQVEAPVASSDDKAGIFSTRTESLTHALVLIKLKAAPLLTTVRIEDGKKTFDSKHAEQISAQQAELEKQLAALSPEIKVIFRYRMVLNALAVSAPVDLYDRLSKLSNVSTVEVSGEFARPTPLKFAANKTEGSKFDLRNSVKFIGALEAHKKDIRGQNIRIGIIDSGIDYTHAMLGGSGSEELYKAIDPKGPAIGFPNEKVVGGIDLAGDDYSPASPAKEHQIPQPDSNPIDLDGHGTHVAGSVAGRGDGVNTYDGVAPEALLYAIKVFGKGGTNDAVVIAGLEYAADPNNDGDPSDHLDVVNLSLGGDFGDPHVLYREAIKNLVKVGMVVVCAAGNEGDDSYIVGAPSVVDDAISVASSVDDTDHNWRFRMIQFSIVDRPEIFVRAYEGALGKPIEKAGDVTGPLVYVGLANADFDEELKSKLKGKVALIDRGEVTFAEKIARAVGAGAIGVVMANNIDEEPFIMSGKDDEKFDIPTVMITRVLAQDLRKAMEKGDVIIKYNIERKFEKPEVIDTISVFSSKGPRSLDSLIKPEIAAPGTAIISAWAGKGNQGTRMSGTSMASPHVAGAMALLKQAYPNLSPYELKALVMGTAKVLSSEKSEVYPVSRQGAGRIQLDKALESPVLALPSSVSIGELTLESRKIVARSLDLKNISKNPVKLSVSLETRFSKNLRMLGPAEISIEPEGQSTLPLRFTVDSWNLPKASNEIDGFIVFKDESGAVVLRAPVLAVVNKVSRVKVDNLFVRSTSEADAQDAVVDLVIRNDGKHAGEAYLFNLITEDGRKIDPIRDPSQSRACDLAGVGYRVIEKSGRPFLQFAAKLYEPLTTWDECHFSVLFDADDDGVADQELVGMKASSLAGLKDVKTFASILLDAGKTREIRKEYDKKVMAGDDSEDIKLNYTPAIEDIHSMVAVGHSTVAIVEAPIEKLVLHPTGALSVRIASSYNSANAVESDDYLDTNEKWIKISTSKKGAGYVDLPEVIRLEPGQSQTISFTKGAGAEALWALYPQNTPVRGGFSRDLQSEIVKPTFQVDP